MTQELSSNALTPRHELGEHKFSHARTKMWQEKINTPSKKHNDNNCSFKLKKHSTFFQSYIARNINKSSSTLSYHLQIKIQRRQHMRDSVYEKGHF